MGLVQQHAHVVVEMVVCDSKIGFQVAVEVTHRHRWDERADGEVGGGAEAAGALAQQHADVGATAAKPKCTSWLA